MSDKRVKRRHRKRISVRFGFSRPEKYGFTDDITHEGLFIRSAVVARPGVKLQIELDLPAGLVALVGEVRWTKKVPSNTLNRLKGGMGVMIIGFLTGEEIYRVLCNELANQWGD
jgi:hypothetical protein